jgi:hypothetical protein
MHRRFSLVANRRVYEGQTTIPEDRCFGNFETNLRKSDFAGTSQIRPLTNSKLPRPTFIPKRVT